MDLSMLGEQIKSGNIQNGVSTIYSSLIIFFEKKGGGIISLCYYLLCNVKTQFSSEKSATNVNFGARQKFTDKLAESDKINYLAIEEISGVYIIIFGIECKKVFSFHLF